MLNLDDEPYSLMHNHDGCIEFSLCQCQSFHFPQFIILNLVSQIGQQYSKGQFKYQTIMLNLINLLLKQISCWKQSNFARFQFRKLLAANLKLKIFTVVLTM